jgi:hypothetical protein
MNPLEVAFNAVVPIFLLIALGYIARKVGVIGTEFVNQASRFVFRISLPMLIFSKVAAIDLSNEFDTSQIVLMVFCAVAVAIGYFLSKIVGGILIKEPNNSRGYVLGAFIQGGFRSNYLIVGYPVMFNLYGDEIALSVALLTLVVIPTANILSIIALTPNNQNSGIEKFKEIVMNIVKNPLIIAIGLAFLSMAAGFEFSQDYPSVLTQFIRMTAGLATPLGLVAIGAFFRFDGFREMIKPTIVATGVKLILMPLIISVLAYLIGMEPMNIILVSVLLGGPAAISSFAMCNEMGGDTLLAGNIIILSSASCVVSYIAMITILLSILN